MSAPPAPAPPFLQAALHLKTVLQGIRTGRASAGLVDHLEVDTYGTKVRLREIASIVTPDARTVQIEPWDRSQIQAVSKAIETSPLGVHPNVAGTVIRLVLPPLTEERRRELTRLVRKHAEEARVSIRTTREKLLRELKSRKESGEISEDLFERERKKLQEDVDAAVAHVDTLCAEKESELLSL